MDLTPDQMQRLREALFDAFPPQFGAMDIVVSNARLKKPFSDFLAVPGTTYEQAMFNLLIWVESQNRIEDLVRSAREENPSNEKLQRVFQELAVGAKKPTVVWNVPYPRNPNFTGRESILAQLEAALASGTPVALTQAIAGLGGVGKTQTAVEYAYRHRDQYRAVLWVRADPGWVRPDPGTNLVSGYHELAEVLGLPVLSRVEGASGSPTGPRPGRKKDARDRDEVVAAVRRWLGREPGYLLILDNADDPALVKPYLPPDPRGHVLLTSRAQNFDVLGVRTPIGLPVLTPTEALEFLMKRTGRKGPLDPAEQDAVRTLAEKLGYLPLALEQAAAYMVEHQESFSDYLAAYRVLLLEVLEMRGPITRLMSSLNDVSGIPTEGKNLIIVAAVNNVLHFRIFDGDGKVVVDTDEKRLTEQARQIEDLRKQLESLWPPHELTRSDKGRVITAVTSIVGHTYPKTVHMTWKRSFDAVARSSLASIELLRLSAFFAPDAVPYELILEGASELGEPLASALTSPPGGNFALNEILTPLACHSLVRRDREAHTYSVHRLVQAVLLDELTDATCRDFAERAIKALNRTFPDTDFANWPWRERLMPHALAVWGWIECFDKGFDLRLMSSLNDVSGIPTEGKHLLANSPRQSFGGNLGKTRPAGKGNPRLTTTKTNSPTVSGNNLIIEAAETIIVAAVNSVLHFRIFDRGGKVVVDTDEKRLTEQAWQIEELRKQLESLWPPYKLTSSEKVRVITAVTSIVGRTLDKSKEPLLVPEAAQLLNQAGYYLYLRARYAEAERLLRRALAIWEARDPDNLDTATGLNNLGVLLRFRGRYFGEAEELLRRALKIREAALGPDHPDTAISLNNLALLLQAQNQYEEAELLLRQALEIREAAHHPDIVYTLNDLAELLRAQGQPGEAAGEAERLLRRALEIRKAALGLDHPDTATSLNSLGVLLRFQGRYCGEAEQLLRRALAIREAALGPDHPDIAQSLNNLAEVLRAQGRPGKAVPLHRRALKIREAALGPDHPDIAQSLNNLAEVLRAQGRPGKAAPLLRRALKIRKAALGLDHQKTAYTRSNLAEVLWAQGWPRRAERLHRGARLTPTWA